MVVSMFSVGEESGRIGEVSKRVADAYNVEWGPRSACHDGTI